MRKEDAGHAEDRRMKSIDFWLIVSLSVFYIMRDMDTLEQMVSVAFGMERFWLRYRGLIA